MSGTVSMGLASNVNEEIARRSKCSVLGMGCVVLSLISRVVRIPQEHVWQLAAQRDVVSILSMEVARFSARYGSAELRDDAMKSKMLLYLGLTGRGAFV
jgi:hypothetical protein